jgi:hypothetical protein
LLGLVYGTIDILRGTTTAVSKTGQMAVIDSNVAPVSNPLWAFVRQVIHLLSDLPTRDGAAAAWLDGAAHDQRRQDRAEE